MAINTVNLKHRFRQIETDERRGHRTISGMKGTYPSRGTDVPDAGGRPSHHAGARLRQPSLPRQRGDRHRPDWLFFAVFNSGLGLNLPAGTLEDLITPAEEATQ